MPDLLDHVGGIARISQAFVIAATRWADTHGRGLVVCALKDAGRTRDVSVCPPRVDYRAYDGRRWRLARDVVALGLRQAATPMVFGHVNLAPLGVAARTRGGRFAVVAHGIEIWQPLSSVRVAALRAAHEVWPVSAYTGDALARRGVRPERIAVIHNCLDPRRALVEPVEPPDAPPRFLAVSRLGTGERDKGVDRLIAAFARADLPAGAGLDVVGDGDDRPRLEALARASGAGDRVVFHGRVDDAEVDRLMDAARAFALPSRVEGFGLVFVEAMARGRAVIAARATAVPEVVADGETGLLVDFEDEQALVAALERLGRDRALAAGLGRAGRLRVERHFHFDRYAEAVARALDRLVADA
ncbi:MAG: glycosyltransferase family 4 protein [Deltaproteobacteria bacterium]|nr:glycosyltransferase family 4 protein [Deltaproteobacteria bacterium]